MKFKSLLILLLLFFINGCGSSVSSTKKQNKPVVVVSIPCYEYFVKRIAGDVVDVDVIVPPGSSPHSYEPSPKKVKDWSQARLWILCGESFEEQIAPSFIEHNPSLIQCKVLEGLPLLHDGCCHHHDHGHDHVHCVDTHVWLSPRLAQLQAKTINEYLVKCFPDHKEKFSHELMLFLEELTAIDQEIAKVLKDSQGKSIFVSHPAFAYFCRDYGLKQVSVEQEGRDPLPQQLIGLVNKARESKITHIFLQKQYSNKAAVCIAQELGLETLYVDPYSSDYINNLKDIAQKFSLN